MNGTRPPIGFWIISVVAVLWNGMGAFNYVITQFEFDFVMEAMTPEQVVFFTEFPVWYSAVWAIAVWSACVASVLLLLRSGWSEFLFGVALIFYVVSAIRNFGFTNAAAIMGMGNLIFSIIIGVSLLGLLWFARVSRQNRWLR